MNDELSLYLNSGIYRFGSSNAIFMDPVRVINSSYSRYRVSPSAYYSRLFEFKDGGESIVSVNSRKRKRKEKRSHALNERELSADRRHQEARPLLLKAHETLLGAADLSAILRNLRGDACSPIDNKNYNGDVEKDVGMLLIELGLLWQAPLYEISLHFNRQNKGTDDGAFSGFPISQNGEQKIVPMFNNLVVNETSDEVEAEFLDIQYIIPRRSCFYISDLEKIHNVIPARSDQGFNLILIDPPWENRSARQKSLYPMLPNHYLLSIPIKQLSHTEGALVALWVTNREKLRIFVEKELFPTWGVRYVTLIYWLKVKADGSLIGELDLFHHRPYECLLLGYCQGEVVDAGCPSSLRPLQDIQVILSIPGDFSRKPPVQKLLLDYAPGPKPARCIELFARELWAGWTSWGNEPLHFQESKYFLHKKTEE